MLKLPSLLTLGILQLSPHTAPPIATPHHLAYSRTLTVPPGAATQVCAILDPAIFPHAAPFLRDLRVFPTAVGAQPHEIPYAITLSETSTEDTLPARILNLGVATRNTITFDLEMPDRPYTNVILDLAGHNFLATATVTGRYGLATPEKSTALGTFTLFDLSAQRLARNTTLPLQESTFRYLHITLSVAPAPGAPAAEPFTPAMVTGAQIPPSRESQILYTPIAETAAFTTVGRETRASFTVPERIPIERVAFVLAPGYKGNFSRDVTITASAAGSEAQPETLTGTILRVHTTESGREIRTEQLGIPAILGANLQHPAKVEIAVDNGDDQPLPLAAVRLEMRQRKLCFDPPASPVALFYGDPALVAPVYDYARLFTAAAAPLVAELGPETPNPGFHPAAAELRPFTERHPEVLWIVLLAVVSALGIVALRSSRNVGSGVD